jgi:two-component system nitrate/nitrite response regulator NarL
MDQQPCVTVLVGENELLLEGLRRILIGADFCVAAIASNIDVVPTSLLVEDLQILVIFNVGVDQNAIVAQVKKFKERRPNAFILLLADYAQLSDVNIVTVFRCGVNAYFMKPSCNTLLKSLELVMAGETILPPTTLSLLLRQHDNLAAPEFELGAAMRVSQTTFTEPSSADDPRLSVREQCILRHLIEGYSNKIIARKIDIAEATVKVHVKAILRKIKVNNRTQAAVWGMNKTSANKEDQAAAS